MSGWTVLVCDDAPAARENLRRSVAGVPGVARVSAAGSGEEVLARFPLERPDVVLLDVRMPGIGGIETVRRLAGAHPEAVVVMLTQGEDHDGVARAVGHGARGYLAKNAAAEEVAATLTSLLEPSQAASNGRRVAALGPAPTLTDRERQVLDGMSRGCSNADIGRELFLSEDTVKTHARRLFRKLQAADRAQAVALGFRWGFLR
jgi:DNA-binding NarL/FixJ family response regulator